MNTIKAMQTPIFFLKPSRGMNSSYVIFFSFTLLKKKKIILWFFMYFLKVIFIHESTNSL